MDPNQRTSANSWSSWALSYVPPVSIPTAITSYVPSLPAIPYPVKPPREELQKKITLEIVVNNLRLLGTFKKNEKVMIKEDEVTLMKEDRVIALTIRRALSGGLNCDVIDLSFELFCKSRKGLILQQLETHPNQRITVAIEEVDKIASAAFAGLKTIRATYYEEGKLPYANRLLEISTHYEELMRKNYKETLEIINERVEKQMEPLRKKFLEEKEKDGTDSD